MDAFTCECAFPCVRRSHPVAHRDDWRSFAHHRPFLSQSSSASRRAAGLSRLGRVPPLRDDAVQPHGARLREQRWPIAGDVVVARQAEGRALEQGLELTLTPLKRQVAQILAVELEQIEYPG